MSGRILSVYNVTKYIKSVFENDAAFYNMHIKGEISNFKYHSLTGHIYFTLIDDKSAISCVMFKDVADKLSFSPKDGMEIIVTGNISVYVKSGRYQIYCEKLILAGDGQIRNEFERLKKELVLKGYFDLERKKPMPAYPFSVAVITSESGAALKDILNISNRRNNKVQIAIVPVLVQGINSPESIAEGIKAVNKWGGADCVIVARGGGSYEDLQSFNTEIVAKAAFNSKIPVISAIGHETDFTILDLVADLRAPTPSAAAELIIPEYSVVLDKLAQIQDRLTNSMDNIIIRSKLRLKSILNKRVFESPVDAYLQKSETVKQLYRLLNNLMDANIRYKSNNCNLITKKFEILSPLNVLKRGYGLVYGESGRLIKSSSEVKNREEISVMLFDSTIKAAVIKNGEEEKEL